MEVPFNQIRAHYLDQKQEINQAIASVLESGMYIGGQFVQDFEQSFSSYHGVNYTVGCASGTDALYLALLALGVGPGDEVITTAFSWISTANAISRTGAVPVFVDVTTKDLQLDLSLAAHAITSRTKALLPVYLYGHTKRRDDLIAFAKRYELALIEDAAQVHGIPLTMDSDGLRQLVCFSFYPTKQLGAIGDAGAILTNDEVLQEDLRKLANMGGAVKSTEFDRIGITSRLDPVQAAVLTSRLKHIESQQQRRLVLARIYDRQLSEHLQKPELHDMHTLYQYVIQVRNRAEITRCLEEHAIGYGIHYGYTLPGTAAYGKRSGFPVAEQAAQKVISLPIDPMLSEDQIAYVCQVLNRITD